MLDRIFPIRRALKKAMASLVKSGEFNAARIICGVIVKFWPNEREAHFALSALAYKDGDWNGARNKLREGVTITPFVTYPAKKITNDHILRVRGVQNSVYLLGKSRNGDYKIKLRGGNFTDFYLTDGGKFTTTSYYILNENILSDRGVPEFGIVLNLISDPDVESKSLQTLSAFLSRHSDIPVVNAPDKVLATTRDNNFQRLKVVKGLCFPKTRRFTAKYSEPEDCIRFLEQNDYSFPLLVREPGTHYGRSFRKLEEFNAFLSYVSESQTEEIYVIQYENSMVSDGIFRKMRVFFVDGEIYPVVCHFDTVWNVHGSNRTETMLKQSWMMDEERKFMNNCESYMGSESYNYLKSLYGVVGLDFFGVDFTVLPNQTVLIFELNPAMRHSYDHADNFPYLLPYLKAITNAFNDMLHRKLASGMHKT